jgi:hypothetical protein
MATLVVGIAGVLGGGLISMLTSLLTLRSSQRAERERWTADRRWEHASALATARQEAYTQFLSRQNALIMVTASTRDEIRGKRRALEQMPPEQTDVYQALEDAWARSLLLASPQLRLLLEETHNYLNELVWASWRGEQAEVRDALYEELLAAMRDEAVAQPSV